MQVFSFRTWLLCNLLIWIGFGCATTKRTSESLRNQRMEEADVSDEEVGLSGKDAASVNESDPANFAQDGASQEEFAAAPEEKKERHELFVDEDPEGRAGESDAVIDPTATGENLAQESIAEDPTALGGADILSEDLLGGDATDPVAAAAAAEAGTVPFPAQSFASDDIDPVDDGSDGSTPLISQVDPTLKVPQAAAAAPIPSENAIQPRTEELEPALSILSWVGYRIQEKDKSLSVEILSRGRPDFEVYEEHNKMNQLELVLRFYQTKLRRKLRFDINSSEFHSPVAYVRMREYKEKGVVDVVLTHRDAVFPQFFAHDGQMILVYKIPEHYFSKVPASARSVKEQASSLIAGNSKPLSQKRDRIEAEPRRIGFPRGGLFQGLPTSLRPIREVIRSHLEDQLDLDGLPEDFDRRVSAATQRSAKVIIERFSLSSVGQDDLDSAESNTENTVEGTVPEASDSTPTQASGSTQTSTKKASATAPDQIQDVPTEFTSSEENTAPSNSSVQVGNPEPEGQVNPGDTDSDNFESPPPIENQDSSSSGPIKDPVSDVIINNEVLGELPQSSNPSPQPLPSSNVDMTGKNSPEATQQYVGKPIFMEFYDAPLSLVLKSFSEETGNNFVYPSSVAAIPVTVHFKGVPWDEALKAILETYSLGMVRIGENVVRIDMITRLTQYMQELEQAKQFETRRIPTRVLVFRLNNAVAKDVAGRIAALLARDIELDARTKLQADDRTNSIIMEASTQVLAKSKSIIERLDLETPQVEIASRIVEVQKTVANFFGFAWGNNFNFDPGRALGFGSLNFPNSVGSSFAVDPGVVTTNSVGVGRFRFGSLNKFIDLDLLLRMEEKKGTTNVLQSNRVLVLDGQKASILSGQSQFFRPAAGAANPVPGGGVGAAAVGLAEVKFNLSLEVKPQITALGAVIMDLLIRSDTPGDPTGEVLATKNTRELQTQMVRDSGDTGVIGGIYNTIRVDSTSGVPFLSDIPILGALFRSSLTKDTQTELLIMVTPSIVSGRSVGGEAAETAAIKGKKTRVISNKDTGAKVRQAL